jgi:hypothetical protein
MTSKKGFSYININNIDYSQLINIDDWLSKNYPSELNHCRANHIWTNLYWRDRSIWQGNYWDIRQIRIKETANPSGTHVFFYSADNKLLASVKESIFIKIGANDKVNPIMQVIVSTTVGALTGLATGGLGGATGVALGKAVAIGAAKGVLAGTIKAGVQQVWHTEHFQQEFTIDEFQHKWSDSGVYPIKLSLEQNNELINRYLANRTLKNSAPSPPQPPRGLGGEGEKEMNISTSPLLVII